MPQSTLDVDEKRGPNQITWIWKFGWLWADPAISILVALLITVSAWSLLRRTAHILLEGTPDDLESEVLINTIRDEKLIAPTGRA